MTETTHCPPVANTKNFTLPNFVSDPYIRDQPLVSGPVVLQTYSQPAPKKKHQHYFKDVSNLNEIDVYRVIELFGVVDGPLQHALKKLLVTGGRDGNKSKEQDVRDVIASCNRWLEMQAENKK